MNTTTIELPLIVDDTFSPPGRRRRLDDPSARNLSPRMARVLERLAMGGVMNAWQLGAPLRSLKHYAALELIQQVVLPKENVAEWVNLFVPDRREETKLKFYCLGPVGEQITRQRFSFAPLTGYLLYTPARVLHDLILNEIVLRLAGAAREAGWRTFWAGTNAAEIRSGSEQLIEPDALLILEKGEERKAFAIEYHNEEDKRQRAFDKVRRYERARERREAWMSAWQVETFPPVLAVFRDQAVGLGYRDAVKELNAKGVYYAKILDGVAAGNLREWLNVVTGSREAVL
jgi:hypothetical protein